MFGEPQPQTTPRAPGWIAEAVVLVERLFVQMGSASATANPTAPLPEVGPWERWQRVWENMSREAWDGQG